MIVFELRPILQPTLLVHIEPKADITIQIMLSPSIASLGYKFGKGPFSVVLPNPPLERAEILPVGQLGAQHHVSCSGE